MMTWRSWIGRSWIVLPRQQPARPGAGPGGREGRGTRGRLGFIDSARALAVILVYLSHATENFRTIAGRHGAWLTRFAYDGNLGRAGVVTFFAISGFLIPSSLGGDRLRGSARFWISRVFRLYPAFAVSVLPSAYLLYTLSGKAFPWGDLPWNFTMVPTWFGADYINFGYWTLETEIAFYLLCFFFFLGGSIRDQFIVSLVVLLGFYAYMSSQMPLFGGRMNLVLSTDPLFLLMHLGVMFWGTLCRHLWDRGRLEPVPLAIFAVFSLYWLAYLPFVTLGELRLPGGLNWNDARLMFGYSGGMAVFALLLVARRGLGAPFAWLGRISYSFYLLHGPTIVIAYYLVDRTGILRHGRMELLVLFGFVLSAALAHLSFHAIERPFIRLGHALSRRFVADAGPAGAPARAVADGSAAGSGFREQGVAHAVGEAGGADRLA